MHRRRCSYCTEAIAKERVITRADPECRERHDRVATRPLRLSKHDIVDFNQSPALAVLDHRVIERFHDGIAVDLSVKKTGEMQADDHDDRNPCEPQNKIAHLVSPNASVRSQSRARSCLFRGGLPRPKLSTRPWRRRSTRSMPLETQPPPQSFARGPHRS